MGDGDHFYRIFAEVTVAQARLQPENAAGKIDRLLVAARRHKLPVYLELPSDIGYLDIEAPAAPLQLATAVSDPERLQACVDAIVERLRAARSPAILLDLDAQRFQVLDEVARLTERWRFPVACLNTCKGALDETSPCFVGVYTGGGSVPETCWAVEDSDCLLASVFGGWTARAIFFRATTFHRHPSVPLLRRRRRNQLPGGDAQGSVAALGGANHLGECFASGCRYPGAA